MKAEHPSIYQIKVQGKLNDQWSVWLAGVTISHDQTGNQAYITTLTGPVVDQAALRGILNKLWDLNLTLLSVKRLEAWCAIW
jgi:hypothetical protein